MSLPFADRPEESRVYQDLKTKVLTNLTANEFDSLKASMFAEGVSGLEDEYRRLLLLGLASDKVSVAGPIEVKNVQLVLSGSEDDPTIFFQPAVGQIWELNWGLWDGDGTSNMFYQGKDATTTPTQKEQIFFSSATSGKMCTDNSAELNGGSKIIVSNTTPLWAQTYNDTSGATWAIWVTRIR